jgi:hypothetical protein
MVNLATSDAIVLKPELYTRTPQIPPLPVRWPFDFGPKRPARDLNWLVTRAVNSVWTGAADHAHTSTRSAFAAQGERAITACVRNTGAMSRADLTVASERVVGCRFCFLPEPWRVIWSTPNFNVQMGLGPLTEGYALILSKSHYSCCADLPPALADEFEGLIRLARAAQINLYGRSVFFEHGRSGACLPPGSPTRYAPGTCDAPRQWHWASRNLRTGQRFQVTQ